MAYRPQWLIDLAKVAPETAKFAQYQLLKSQNIAYSATTQAKLTNDKLQPNKDASNIVSSLTNFVSDIGRQAQNFVSGNLSGLTKAFENLPDVLKSAFDAQTKNITDFVSQKISDTQKSIESFTAEASKRLSDFASSAKNVIDSVNKFATDTKDMIVGEFVRQGESISRVFNSVVKFVSDSVIRSVSDFRSAIENVSKQFGDAIDTAIKNTAQAFSVVAIEIKNSIESTIKAVSDSFNDLLLTLSLGFDGLTKAFFEVWKFDAEKLVSQQLALQKEVAKRQLEFVRTQ